MTPKEKENIHIRLRDALEEEKISQLKAGNCLGINQAYVSMIKLGTNLKAVPDKIWGRLVPWAISNLPIADFDGGILIHQGNTQPEREPLKIKITTVGDFEHPEIPTFEEIEKEMAEANVVDIPLKQPIVIETREIAMRRFNEQRMMTLKIAIQCVLKEGDKIDPVWVYEYNEIWETLNQ